MGTPVKITGLPAATSLGGTEVVGGVQGTSGTYGGTVKILISQIGTYVRGLFTTTPATIAEGGTNAATIAAARTALGTGELVPVSSVAGTNTVTGTIPAANSSYDTRAVYVLIPAATNTGALTVNLTPSGGGALGAKSVFNAGSALIGGEFVISVPVCLVYDGTQLNIVGNTTANGTTASTLTWNGSGSTSGSITLTWTLNKKDRLVTINVPPVSATTGTNSNIFQTDTALPVAIRPVAQNTFALNNLLQNASGIASAGQITVTTGGLIQIVKDNANANFTNSVSCGIGTAGVTFTYFIG